MLPLLAEKQVLLAQLASGHVFSADRAWCFIPSLMRFTSFTGRLAVLPIPGTSVDRFHQVHSCTGLVLPPT